MSILYEDNGWEGKWINVRVKNHGRKMRFFLPVNGVGDREAIHAVGFAIQGRAIQRKRTILSGMIYELHAGMMLLLVTLASEPLLSIPPFGPILFFLTSRSLILHRDLALTTRYIRPGHT